MKARSRLPKSEPEPRDPLAWLKKRDEAYSKEWRRAYRAKQLEAILEPKDPHQDVRNVSRREIYDGTDALCIAKSVGDIVCGRSEPWDADLQRKIYEGLIRTIEWGYRPHPDAPKPKHWKKPKPPIAVSHCYRILHMALHNKYVPSGKTPNGESKRNRRKIRKSCPKQSVRAPD